MVKLRWPDGTLSDWHDREDAAIIRVFSFKNWPEIVEKSALEAELVAAPTAKGE
jgi:hypothetical protein